MIIEIRTYRLVPGTRDDFVEVMRNESVPLLREYGIDVVDCGASLVDEDGHEEAYLIRAFASREEHRRQEDRFYASAQWRDGPREAIVSRIESYHAIVIVIEASDDAVAALRSQ
ncbi:NIPSNAP family protein [Nocardia crassostreae]|uniref:NIPSNAP family protein n=1 Tax=Nocardia crassostreae TaxID=53428 RepID=UPI00082B7802|nr:NIPSNAP family protein [Nocardia crassostreae]